MSIRTSILRHEIDKNIAVQFELGVDCVGEVLYAEVYVIGQSLVGNVNKIKPTDLDPIPEGLIYGGLKGQLRTMLLDFTSIPQGTGYSLVIHTYETGLINKGPLVILSSDGFTV
jgi:hypothetical protein